MKRIAIAVTATIAALVLLVACNDTGSSGTAPGGSTSAPSASSTKTDDGRGTNDQTAKPGETK